VGKTELAFRYSNYFEEGGTVNGVAVRLNGSTLEAAVREGSAQQNTGTFIFQVMVHGIM
jgi:hypothetical protein